MGTKNPLNKNGGSKPNNSALAWLLGLIVMAGASALQAAAPNTPISLDTIGTTRLVEGYGKLLLNFEPNQGQTDLKVKFHPERGGALPTEVPNQGTNRFTFPSTEHLRVPGGKELKGGDIPRASVQAVLTYATISNVPRF